LMMVVQLLDGVTGAAVTVLTILVVTDLTTGTGRFNLAQGVLGTITGTAAAVSTGSGGCIVPQFGDLAGFLVVGATTTAGAALIWAFLPETKPAKTSIDRWQPGLWNDGCGGHGGRARGEPRAKRHDLMSAVRLKAAIAGTSYVKARFRHTIGAPYPRATAYRSGLRPRTVATGVSYCIRKAQPARVFCRRVTRRSAGVLEG